MSTDLSPISHKIARDNQRLNGFFVFNAMQNERCRGPFYVVLLQHGMNAQLLIIEISDARLEVQRNQVAATLHRDRRYRPVQFAAMLANLTTPLPGTSPGSSNETNE
jgi:hypothetical protein